MQGHEGIQQMGFLLGILPVVPQQGQYGLGGVFLRPEGVHNHAFPVKVAALYLVCGSHDHRQLGNQADGGAQLVFDAPAFALRVIGVQRQHGPGHFVHDVVGGRLEDHIHHEIIRQGPAGGQVPGKGIQLLPVGQLPQQQQIDGFLKAEAVFLLRVGNQVVDLIPPVDELSGDGVDFPLVDHIAVYVADLGDAGNDAGAVAAPQPPLYMEPVVQLGLNPGAGDQLVAQGLEIHHIFILLVHGMPPFSAGGLLTCCCGETAVRRTHFHRRLRV